MSEFFDVIPSEMYQPQMEVKVQERKQHEFRLVGRQRRIPGHTLFCIDLRTGEVKVAPMERSTVVNFKTREPEHKERVVVEPHCVYRQALNKKNFIKRLKRERIIVSRVPKEGDVVVDAK